jgi:FPC/CPF motif-containing protein YcgG
MSKHTAAEVEQVFSNFIMKENFPCLGARGALAKKGASVRVFTSLGAKDQTALLSRQLEQFGKTAQADDKSLKSFIAVFPETPALTEIEFDSLLWGQLEQLRAMDIDASIDPDISDDPADPNFSFRFKGTAYFVVGLCPTSSRLARRFDWPALVFNPHAMFDRLKADGKYERLKSAIRTREIALQGNLNPNLADFGEVSEARQYSGLQHAPEWKCPFHKGS